MGLTSRTSPFCNRRKMAVLPAASQNDMTQWTGKWGKTGDEQVITMTDEEFLAVLAAHRHSTSEQVWTAVVARAKDDWLGDLNWEVKSDNA